ncbi:MAG TPA: nuclear transport factor 2 family protein [Gaiellaceae bacterium]
MTAKAVAAPGARWGMLRPLVPLVIISSMGNRQERVQWAFAALDGGDVHPFRELLDPDAKWVAVPQSADVAETPICASRAAIVDRLERVHRNGRRFQLGRLIEAGDRIAVEVTLLAPEWSGPVTLFRVFTFAPDTDAVVRMNDCIDESYALQVLVA